jgi:ABC-type lipoprotein release transport system permease subunit
MAVPITFRFNEEELNNWNFRLFNTYILVKEGINIQALKEKLDKVEVQGWDTPISLVLTPIKELRYKDPSGNIQSDIKFAHIQIFTIAGLLVILCSLFNHLTLYVTRVRMRLRELALRKVNGATDWQIAATLYTDFLLIVVLSLVVGFMLMAWLLPTFKEYATIGNNNIGIYAELSLYAALLIVLSFLVGSIPVLYFRKQVLIENIKGSGSPGSRNLFRKGSLLVQLIISLGMIFCAVVFIKQIRFLQDTDLGINRRNVAAVSASCCPLRPHYADVIKQVPGVIDALPVSGTGFLRNMSGGSQSMNYEKDGEQKTYTYSVITAYPHFFDFFGIEIIEGTVYTVDDFSGSVYNETAVKELGEEALSHARFNPKIGVARDFYLTPTTKATPTSITYPDPNKYGAFFRAIAYKYEEGMREQTEQAVKQWLREEFPEQGEFEINFAYMEDVFEEHFKSERELLKLLSVMTLACILIAVFGVYSLTSLTCEQRRKEIAIRKINGAEVTDIMNIFFREYLLMLGLAALVAFPAGFVIMKSWLEGYVKQTSMDAWLYVLIFLIVFVVIVFSIVSMVWKAANRNPAETVKTE